MTIRPNRRDFLHVGFAGGIGLTLADFLRLRVAGRRHELRKQGRDGRLGDPHLPARRNRAPGDLRSQAVRSIEYRGWGRSRPRSRASSSARLSADGPGGRQAHGHPLDDARRGGPRARHAQHVHRLPAQPGPAVSRAWAASSPTSIGPKNNLPPYVCVPNQPNAYAGTGYLSSSFSPFSLGSDPADPRFQVQDLNLPGGITSRGSPTGGRCSMRSTPISPRGKERQHRGDGHVLPAGLQPDQLAEGARGVQHRRRAGQDPRRVRPQRRRPAAADGAAAGGRRRAVRHRRLRRLGHAHPDRRRHERPDARRSTRRSPP